jgi:hypothetical protein
LGDKLEHFQFLTRTEGGAADSSYNPDNPMNPAFWTLYITGNPAGVAHVSTGTHGDPSGITNPKQVDVSMGIPLPHRISARVSYMVQFFTPSPVMEQMLNVPLNAQQSMETEGGEGASDFFGGGVHAERRSTLWGGSKRRRKD